MNNSISCTEEGYLLPEYPSVDVSTQVKSDPSGQAWARLDQEKKDDFRHSTMAGRNEATSSKEVHPLAWIPKCFKCPGGFFQRRYKTKQQMKIKSNSSAREKIANEIANGKMERKQGYKYQNTNAEDSTLFITRKKKARGKQLINMHNPKNTRYGQGSHS